LDTYKADLLKLHDFLYELTGVDSKIVRFPGGSSNTISKVDMGELISYLDEQDMIYFDWNVSSQDASSVTKSTQDIADNVINGLGKFNNSVVLFHDASNKDTTVEALPIIIDKVLESEDSVFLPISDDTVLVQHVH
jgi:peptidoglycan/xylan/chitin deacetylase (PgdA/CDA1 family)